jgi:hypothetical protein
MDTNHYTGQIIRLIWLQFYISVTDLMGKKIRGQTNVMTIKLSRDKFGEKIWQFGHTMKNSSKCTAINMQTHTRVHMHNKK